jgi:hypothetical protein
LGSRCEYVGIIVACLDGRGYIEFVRELKTQLQEGRTSGVTHFDDIVMACGRFMLHYSLYSLLFLYAG